MGDPETFFSVNDLIAAPVGKKVFCVLKVDLNYLTVSCNMLLNPESNKN